MWTEASHSPLRTILRVEVDGRRDLDDLLVAALHRAIALVQVEDVAVLVAEDLHLDVLGLADKALEEYRVVAERALRLGARLVEQESTSWSGSWTTRMPRPPPPKAALMMSGKPIFVAAILDRLVAVGDRIVGAREHGHLGLGRQRPRGDLVAHHVEQGVKSGPTKVMPASAQALANSAFSERKP